MRCFVCYARVCIEVNYTEKKAKWEFYEKMQTERSTLSRHTIYPTWNKWKRTGSQAASLNCFCQCSTDKKADTIKRKIENNKSSWLDTQVHSLNLVKVIKLKMHFFTSIIYRAPGRCAFREQWEKHKMSDSFWCRVQPPPTEKWRYNRFSEHREAGLKFCQYISEVGLGTPM